MMGYAFFFYHHNHHHVGPFLLIGAKAKLLLLLLMLVVVYDEMIIQLSDWCWCGRGCTIQVYYCTVSTHQLLDFLLIGNDNCQPATSQPTHNTHKQQLQVDGGARTPPCPGHS